MIYSLASQMRLQPHLATQPQQAPIETKTLWKGARTTPVPKAAASRSVVEVTKPPSDQPSEAYVEPPEMTILRVDAPENRPRMLVQPPSYAQAHTAQLPPSNPAPVALASPSPSAASFKRAPIEQPTTALSSWSTSQSTPILSQSDDAAGKPASAATAARPHTVTLWSGTPLTVKLIDPLSTERVKEGQYFHATLASPIVRDGFVIAEAGSGVTGKVITSKHAGLFGHAPDLRLVLVELRTTDNQLVHVQTTSWDDRGRGHNLVSGTVRSAFGAVSGAVTGAVRGSGLLAEDRSSTDGRNVFVPSNSILEFRLAAPVSLTERTR